MSINAGGKAKQSVLTTFLTNTKDRQQKQTVPQKLQKDSIERCFKPRSPSIFDSYNKHTKIVISSSDDEAKSSPIKSKNKEEEKYLNGIKENLLDLSVEMDGQAERPKTGSFKLRQKSTKDACKAGSSLNLIKPQPIVKQPESNVAGIKLPLTFKKFKDNDDDSFFVDSQDFRSQENTQRVKTNIFSKPLASSTQISFLSLCNEERNKTVRIPAVKNLAPRDPPNTKLKELNSLINVLETGNESMTSSKANNISSMSEADQHDNTYRQSETTLIRSPRKSCLDEIERHIASPKKIRPVTFSMARLKRPKQSPPDVPIQETQVSPAKEVALSINCNVLEEITKLSKDTSIDQYELQKLKDIKLKFLEHYFNAMSQIPMTFFSSVKGYDLSTFVKLKMAITSIDRRIKTKQVVQRDPSPEEYKIPSPSYSPINEIDYDDYEDNDQQVSFGELINNLNEEKLKCAGKTDRSYVNLSELSSPVAGSSGQFKPRINMAQNNRPQISHNTEYIENINTEFDDDGFPKIDYASLVDVIPSQPSTSSSSISTSTSTKHIKQTLDSMVPDANTRVKINEDNAFGNFHSGVKNDGLTGEFDNTYEHSVEMEALFKYKFGLKNFRPNQKQAINATMLRKDVFILMPTGGGKSLCYQLPAVLSKGVTIVVSPLKSLIFDQVNKLNSLNIEAAALSGEKKVDDTKRIYSDIASITPRIKLLYVTPEKISASAVLQNIFDSMHKRGNLARIVIDEAHCVSAWGHDFRPDYKKLGVFKKRYPNVPMMALTATANPRVRIDVVKQLNIYGCKWFLNSFNRPNLKYIVTPKVGPKCIEDLINLIKSKFPNASGIIYCLSRKDCDSVAEKLKQHCIKAVSYHAGMSDEKREKVQREWITDSFRVVCATIAFGMGIDKPDVRYVMHYSMPKSIEGFYQEAGRAGRDGEIATCILYYNYSDKMRYLKLFENESNLECKQVSVSNLDLMVRFCENMTDCRRAQQLEYFGEHFTREQCLQNKTTACDNCLRITQFKEIDVTDICKTIVNSVHDISTESRSFTILHMVEVFKGASNKKVVENQHNESRYHGFLNNWDRSDIQRLFHKLVIDQYLREQIKFINEIPQTYVRTGPKVAQLMLPNSKAQIKFAVMEKTKKSQKRVEVAGDSKVEANNKLAELYDSCFSELMQAAKNLAEERHVTVPTIVNLEALKEMSRKLPSSKAALLRIQHVTEANYNIFGELFLGIIINYAAEKETLETDYASEMSKKAGGVSYINTSEIDDDNYEDYNASTNWNQVGSESNQRSSIKRKYSWRGSASKKFRSGGRAKARRSPAKNKRGAASSRGRRRTTASAFRLMPIPGL